MSNDFSKNIAIFLKKSTIIFTKGDESNVKSNKSKKAKQTKPERNC